MIKKKVNNFKTFILDLDGVFTNGAFFYSVKGKEFKEFGADDHDALRLLSSFLQIQVVTADSKGFQISEQRIVNDMNFPLTLVKAEERAQWLIQNFEPSETIYMGDGILDPLVFSVVGYSIAPANALAHTKKSANFVTKNQGGDRAVAEACLHIAKTLLRVDLLDFQH